MICTTYCCHTPELVSLQLETSLIYLRRGGYDFIDVKLVCLQDYVKTTRQIWLNGGTQVTKETIGFWW